MQKTVDLVTFTQRTLNGKLQFLFSMKHFKLQQLRLRNYIYIYIYFNLEDGPLKSSFEEIQNQTHRDEIFKQYTKEI